jgi:hypothetical protein
MLAPAQGLITLFAGNGSTTSSGDGGPATSAGLGFPKGIAVDSSGNVYIVDALNKPEGGPIGKHHHRGRQRLPHILRGWRTCY